LRHGLLSRAAPQLEIPATVRSETCGQSSLSRIAANLPLPDSVVTGCLPFLSPWLMSFVVSAFHNCGFPWPVDLVSPIQDGAFLPATF
jgi:hypothetical protein